VSDVNDSVLTEAQSLVHGDRGVDYGHPLFDFGRTAGMVNKAFAHLLKDGASFSAEDIGLIMILVKVSRQINRPKRDNLTDIAGYAETINMVLAKREELASAQGNP
jgi:hypothetical protein